MANRTMSLQTADGGIALLRLVDNGDGTYSFSSEGDVVETPRTIVANQSVAYTDTAGTSSAVNASTTEVVVTLTTDGYIAIGAAPTATTGGMFLPAYVPSPPLSVTSGVSKVSAIRDASSGTMKIAEFSR